MEGKTTIYSKNMDVSEKTNSYIMGKINKIGRFLPDVDDIRIDLDSLKSARNSADRFVSQITIRGKGYILRTEERAEDLYSSFDLALDKMIRQIERFKGKRSRVRGDGTSVADTMPIEHDHSISLEPEENEPVIARRKKFNMAPMDENEAIEQMQLLDHEDFFIFYNANTSSVNVIYKRHDGTFGLIEPEIS